MVRLNDGVAHYSGLQTCGSVWACPSCSVKIRQGRADELGPAVNRWLAAGGGVEFVTLTVPHRFGDDLEGLFDTVAEGWRVGVIAGRRFAEERKAWGIPAWVRTIEVTYGQHGWHPHIHALLFTDEPLDARNRRRLGRRLFGRWATWVHRSTGRRCAKSAFRIVGGVEGVGQYLTKLQDGGNRHLGMELTRTDLKRGRKGSCTPFELIPAAAAGEAGALRAWWEWERVSKGRRCLTWSLGARQLLGLTAEEATDRELAEEEVGGDLVAQIDPHTWRLLASILGADSAMLTATELDGADGAGRYLAELRTLRQGPAP